MTASTETQHTTPLADFSAAIPFNLPIWRREVAQIVMTEQPFAINQVGSNVVAQWSSNAAPADLAAYDAEVPNHIGGNITAAPQVFASSGEESSDATTPQTKLAAVSPLLAAGRWMIGFGAETRQNAADDTSAVEFTLGFSKGANPVTEQVEDVWGEVSYHLVSGAFTVNVLDGEQLNTTLFYRRIGTSNPAFIRRARIEMVRIGD